MKKKTVPKNSATSNPTIDWSFLLNSLPPVILRHRWHYYSTAFGIPFARGTLQNFDSKGTGPAKVMFGNRVGYTREAVVVWLNSIGKDAAASGPQSAVH